MNKSKKDIIIYLILPLVICLSLVGFGIGRTVYVYERYVSELEEKISSLEDELARAILYEPDFFYLSPKDGLMAALEYYDVKNPEIVYAQAILETGNFKSSLCVYSNNLFGLYDSKNSKYHSFNHWTESVKFYRDHVQHRYREDTEDYYKFLTRIGYASDSLYVPKLKNIINNPDSWK